MSSLQGLTPSGHEEEQATNLHCITYNELDRRKWLAAKDVDGKRRAWVLKFHYLHATDCQHARFEFIMGRPNKSLAGVDIVAIAPAVGRLANDSNGDNLVADCLTK